MKINDHYSVVLDPGSDLGTADSVPSLLDFMNSVIFSRAASEDSNHIDIWDSYSTGLLVNRGSGSWKGLQYKRVYNDATSDDLPKLSHLEGISPVSNTVLNSFKALVGSLDVSEASLYEITEQIVPWVAEANLIDHLLIAYYFRLMPDLGKHIFLATLCNVEFATSCDYLIDLVVDSLNSASKSLAQNSASFLCICAGDQGRTRLSNYLLKAHPPNRPLIQGIVDILR